MKGPAQGCLPLPAPFLSAHMAHRVSQQHLACRFSFLYLVISNKSGCRKGVLLALCFVLLGQGSCKQLVAVLMAGSPCRAWGAKRATKPVQGHAVFMSLPAPLFLGPR